MVPRAMNKGPDAVAAAFAEGNLAEPAFDELKSALGVFERLALAAGRKILEIYAGSCEQREKADGSPVGEADEGAEAIVLAGLAADLSEIPAISEEAASRGHVPEAGSVFILVDPLDGTREFFARNGEFTVNIALIAGHAPRAGVVYAPVRGLLWSGVAAASGERLARACQIRDGAGTPVAEQASDIHARTAGADGWTAVCSRSHIDSRTEDFLTRLQVRERVRAGSSAKFCMLAEGKADIYPRFSPTMEWDTAAGDAVLRAAGGCVLGADGQPLAYGKEGYRNAGFLALGDCALSSRIPWP